METESRSAGDRAGVGKEEFGGLRELSSVLIIVMLTGL